MIIAEMGYPIFDKSDINWSERREFPGPSGQVRLTVFAAARYAGGSALCQMEESEAEKGQAYQAAVYPTQNSSMRSSGSSRVKNITFIARETKTL